MTIAAIEGEARKPKLYVHLTGKKVVKRNKPYRTVYEIRLLRKDQERVSTPPQRG
jgi:hypothetical protein